MRRRSIMVVLFAVAGCGPSDHDSRERTLSVLNVEAERWPGGKDFVTSAVDGYGRPVSARIEKGPLNYRLELRSSGRDGLPGNTDDIEVTRAKRHGESLVTEQAAKDVGKVSNGAVRGALQGIKEEFGIGRKDKK